MSTLTSKVCVCPCGFCTCYVCFMVIKCDKSFPLVTDSFSLYLCGMTTDIAGSETTGTNKVDISAGCSILDSVV